LIQPLANLPASSGTVSTVSTICIVANKGKTELIAIWVVAPKRTTLLDFGCELAIVVVLVSTIGLPTFRLIALDLIFTTTLRRWR